MIEERFLETAVRIRRSYLKSSNNLEMYHRKAKELVKDLEEILEKVQNLSNEIENDKSSGSPVHTKETAVAELVKILQDLEVQGKNIEEMANPINSEIEKLAFEEQELYRQIKEKHNNISDEELIKIVRDRLEIEGLS